MTYAEVQPIALAIMTSIITGGFVLVFVEIGNRKNRENDRHEVIMSPFMHKLSAYFRFINWCRIVYPPDINEKEQSFKALVDEMSKYGSALVLGGGDYHPDDFTAKQLYDIAFKINNIWYFHDKMNHCRLQWEDSISYDGTDFVAKELKEINPLYLSEQRSVDLVAKVSGEFYTDIYQQIEHETLRHESYLRQFNTQTVWVASFFSFVLLILCLMLFVKLPVLILQFASACIVLMLVMSLLTLAIDVKVWVKWKSKRRWKAYKRKENGERRRYSKGSGKKERVENEKEAIQDDPR